MPKFENIGPRGAARFREREVARVVRAARTAGASVVEVDPATGKIRVMLGKAEDDAPTKETSEQIIERL